MRTRPVILGIGMLFAAAVPGFATQPFGYFWVSPKATGVGSRIVLRWREGSLGGNESAYLNQLGHWYRLAESLWPARGVPVPLWLEVSLYGPEAGSGPERLEARSGNRIVRVAPPYDDQALRAALQRLAGDTEVPTVPPDDAHPRFSDDGEWLAFVTWRRGPPEVWIGSRQSENLYRVPTADAGSSMADRLIAGPPVWSPDGHLLAYVVGRRLCIVSLDERAAVLATPPEFPVAEFAWSPGLTQPLAVRSTEGRLALVDLLERRFVPAHRLLADVEALGDLSWSPTGRRLLFRARGGMSQVDLRGGPSRSEAVEDRLAMLEVNAQRFTSVSLAGTPLVGGRVTGILWEPGEAAVYAAFAREEREHGLIRVPVQGSGRAQLVIQSPEPVHAIGWRSVSRGREPLQTASLRMAFLVGDRVMLANPGAPDELAQPYSPTEMMILALPPGPSGGYRGAEEAVITDPEPGRRLYLESSIHTNAQPSRRQLPNGLHVALPLNAAVVPALQRLARQGRAVDADVMPQTDSLSAAVMVSDGGRAARLLLIDRRPGASLTEAQERDFSAEVSQREPGLLALDARPFPVVDPHAGLEALSGRFDQWNWQRGFASLIVLGLIGAGIWLFSRLARRRGGHPPESP